MPTRILVADDHGDIRDIVAQMLAAHGYTAVPTDCAAAMEDILDDGKSVDGIVLGCSVLSDRVQRVTIHAQELGLPVVLVTDTAEGGIFAEEHSLRLVIKPFAMADLIAIVEDALVNGSGVGRRA